MSDPAADEEKVVPEPIDYPMPGELPEPEEEVLHDHHHMPEAEPKFVDENGQVT